MKFIKSLGLVSMLIISSTSLYAQKNLADGGEKAAKMTQKMSEGLELTAEQTEQVSALNTEFVANIQALKQDESTGPEERQAAIKELKSSHEASIKEILTAEQYAQFEASMQEKREKHEARRQEQELSPEERASLHTERMADEIDMTPEQVEQVMALNEKVEQKIEAIKKDETMSPEKKKEFIKGNRKDQMTALKSILTEEQFDQLKAAKQSH